MNYFLRFFKKYIEIYYKMVKLNNEGINIFIIYATQDPTVTQGNPIEVFGITNAGVADSSAWLPVYDTGANALGNVWASPSASSITTKDVKKNILTEFRKLDGTVIFSGSTSSWQDGVLTEVTHTGSLTVKRATAAGALDAGFSVEAIRKVTSSDVAD